MRPTHKCVLFEQWITPRKRWAFTFLRFMWFTSVKPLAASLHAFAQFNIFTINTN